MPVVTEVKVEAPIDFMQSLKAEEDSLSFLGTPKQTTTNKVSVVKKPKKNWSLAIFVSVFFAVIVGVVVYEGIKVRAENDRLAEEAGKSWDKSLKSQRKAFDDLMGRPRRD